MKQDDQKLCEIYVLTKTCKWLSTLLFKDSQTGSKNKILLFIVYRIHLKTNQHKEQVKKYVNVQKHDYNITIR